MILLIESRQTAVENMQYLLNESYDLVVARSAQEALKMYRSLFFKVRVILLSNNVEDMVIQELFAQLKSISMLPEIIVYSENEDIGLAVDVMKLGASDFIKYPLTKNELIDAIDSTLEGVDNMKKLEDMSLTKLSDDTEEDTPNNESLESRLKDSSISPDELLELFPLGTRKEALSFLDLDNDKLNSTVPTFSSLSKNILVVEDEDIYRLFFNDLLEKEFTVFSAANGHEGLEKLRDNKIDLILLDIFLPDISGSELIPQFKQINPDVEIIVVTAYEYIDIAIKSIKDGASDYINKPILKEELISIIHRYLHKKSLREALPKIGKQIFSENLSYEFKIDFLDNLFKKRKGNQEKMTMEDIYFFFPELKKTFIPEGLAIPEKVLNEGMNTFITELKEKLGYYNTAE